MLSHIRGRHICILNSSLCMVLVFWSKVEYMCILHNQSELSELINVMHFFVKTYSTRVIDENVRKMAKNGDISWQYSARTI